MNRRAPTSLLSGTAFLLSALVLAALPAAAQVTSDRIAALSDYHGYYPCMDCHGDQETIFQPRILAEEHATPLEWTDDDGGIHAVPYGTQVTIAELLGQTDRHDLNAVNRARVGERVGIADYMAENDLTPDDTVWALLHGGGNLWCLDCHDAADRDKLVRFDGQPLSFNESHLLCGSCHGPKLLDWERGIHGKTVGRWDLRGPEAEEAVRWQCVECHNPHAPAFLTLEPEAAPVPRVGGSPSGHEHHDAEHEELEH